MAELKAVLMESEVISRPEEISCAEEIEGVTFLSEDH